MITDWLGSDSLGRELDSILFQTLINSFGFGISVGLLITLLLVFALFIWYIFGFNKQMTRILIVTDHIIPKIIFLMILTSTARFNQYTVMFTAITLVLLPSVLSQLMVQLKAQVKQPLLDFYATRSNHSVMFIYEILPLVRSVLILIFFTSVINSILLETVLTQLGIGFEFGIPTIGFLLSDGLSYFYINKMELITALFLILCLAVSGAVLSNKMTKSRT